MTESHPEVLQNDRKPHNYLLFDPKWHIKYSAMIDMKDQGGCYRQVLLYIAKLAKVWTSIIFFKKPLLIYDI